MSDSELLHQRLNHFKAIKAKNQKLKKNLRSCSIQETDAKITRIKSWIKKLNNGKKD